MRAPFSSGSGVPVKRWAAAPQPSAGSDTHSSSKPRSANQSQICDQPGADVGPAGVAGQGADQVAALARAQADDAQRARLGLVKSDADLLLDRGQAPGQRGGRVVVVVVPGVPVAFGHVGHGTDGR
jgi:hypothetical protein